MKHVFIIGSKGIPAKYGGFETFADRLVSGKKSGDISYHVACMDHVAATETYKEAECFHLAVPKIGPAKAVLYDLKAFRYCLREIREKDLSDAVILVLACRLGPFFHGLVRRAHRRGVRVFVNPDGHEWMRAKWNAAIKRYWKYSEKLMVRDADLLLCDSMEMERYIREEYKDLSPKTTYLSYGADTASETVPEKERVSYEAWLTEHRLTRDGYALVVGRFVPENNYETMLREYLSTSLTMPLVLICNVEKNRFYEKLAAALPLETDSRVLFAGTVYDEELLRQIRSGAAFYIHGHEVGGTNPTLLEALGSTEVNLLLDVPFNREVGADAAFYWTKEEGSLGELCEFAAKLGTPQRKAWGFKAKNRIREAYAWGDIILRYEELFLS